MAASLHTSIPKDVGAVIGADIARTSLKERSHIVGARPVRDCVCAVEGPQLHTIAPQHDRTLKHLVGLLYTSLGHLKVRQALPVAVTERKLTE